MILEWKAVNETVERCLGFFCFLVQLVVGSLLTGLLLLWWVCQLFGSFGVVGVLDSRKCWWNWSLLSHNEGRGCRIGTYNFMPFLFEAI